MGATLNRGRSRQAVRTPPEFLAAVEAKFGRLTFDLAATEKNAVCKRFFTKRQDALTRRWPVGLNWLNPPFDNIAPWVAKCAEESRRPGVQILVLVPASIGSNWYRDHVEGKAAVIPVGNPRLKFVGHPDGFPKDLMLICYGLGQKRSVLPQWQWKNEFHRGVKAA